jgi:acyl-CoA thioester hydrolase
VVRRDEVEYFREVSLLEPITVTLALGGWLDLTTRRLTAPPPDVLTALQRLPHTEDFEELPSSLRT